MLPNVMHLQQFESVNGKNNMGQKYIVTFSFMAIMKSSGHPFMCMQFMLTLIN